MAQTRTLTARRAKTTKETDGLTKRIATTVSRPVTLIPEMVKDYVKGRYRNVPWMAITAAGVGALYLASPIDLIPDFIPVLGITDDMLVLAIVAGLIAGDLTRYALWKRARLAR
jgi:uncharacterized membrane protein YkvA (DUF1232 family)